MTITFSRLEIYKVVQHADFIIICRMKDHLPGGHDLVAGSMTTCCEFLIRYTEARSDGLDPDAATDRALVGAQIVSRLQDLNKPR